MEETSDNIIIRTRIVKTLKRKKKEERRTTWRRTRTRTRPRIIRKTTVQSLPQPEMKKKKKSAQKHINCIQTFTLIHFFLTWLQEVRDGKHYQHTPNQWTIRTWATGKKKRTSKGATIKKRTAAPTQEGANPNQSLGGETTTTARSIHAHT